MGLWAESWRREREARTRRASLLCVSPCYKTSLFCHFPVYKFQETRCLPQEGEPNSYLEMNSRAKESGVYIQAGPLHTLSMSPLSYHQLLGRGSSVSTRSQNTHPSPGHLIWHIRPGPSCLLCTSGNLLGSWKPSGLLGFNVSSYLGNTPTLRAVPTSAPLSLRS